LVLRELLPERRDRAALKGLLLGSGAALLVGAWWLIPRLGFFAHFFGFWYGRPRATIGTLALASVPLLIKGYAKLLVAADGIYALVLGVLLLTNFSAVLGREEGPFRRRVGLALKTTVDVPALWLAVCPLLILLALRSNNALYGLPAVVAFYLAAALPTASALGRRAVGKAAKLAIAAAVAALAVSAVVKGTVRPRTRKRLRSLSCAKSSQRASSRASPSRIGACSMRTPWRMSPPSSWGRG
jgi:hypothetical protein